MHHALTVTATRCRGCLASGRTFAEQNRLHRAAQDRYRRTYGIGIDGPHLPRLTRCSCRPAKRHPDCQYCGAGFWGEVVCGVCHDAGIDGRLIPGTGARRCSAHRRPR